MTSNISKTAMSPQLVTVVGWPNRQNTTSLSISFRIYVGYQYPDVCPSGKIFDSATKTCVSCSPPCSTCLSSGPNASPTACTWCQPGYTLLANNYTCIIKTSAELVCPIGTIQDPVLGMCRGCPAFCTACTIEAASATCTGCVAGYNLANGSCY